MHDFSFSRRTIERCVVPLTRVFAGLPLLSAGNAIVLFTDRLTWDFTATEEVFP